MTIEMGESLTFTWLRHICGCQIVQTNWKVSPMWEKGDIGRASSFMNQCNVTFRKKTFKLDIFKKNASYDQVLNQGECDALGIKQQGKEFEYYGVDVAFHTNGLDYGKGKKTVAKVIEKCVRTAMCLYVYLGIDKGNIIFLSPKIQPKQIEILEGKKNAEGIEVVKGAIKELNDLFKNHNFGFEFKLYHGETFRNKIIEPVLDIIDNVKDTSELFLRSIQLLNVELYDLVPIGFGQQKKRPKYLFGDKTYAMGRLAVEIIQRYVAEQKESGKTITFEDLKKEFPQKLDNNKPLIMKKSDKDCKPSRAFTKKSELIDVDGPDPACVNSQWTKRNMITFLRKVRRLGYDVQEIVQEKKKGKKKI